MYQAEGLNADLEESKKKLDAMTQKLKSIADLNKERVHDEKTSPLSGH